MKYVPGNYYLTSGKEPFGNWPAIVLEANASVMRVKHFLTHGLVITAYHDLEGKHLNGDRRYDLQESVPTKSLEEVPEE